MKLFNNHSHEDVKTMVPVLFAALMAVVACWYEPVTDVNDEFNADKTFQSLVDSSSAEEDYTSKSPSSTARSSPGYPELELSLSDIDERINEYPPKDIVSQDRFIPIADDVEKKVGKMDELKKALNSKLGTDGLISGLHDKDMWKKLHKYLELNFGDFMIDGHLSIELHIRYILCSYVVVFIPAQFAFFFPAFYTIFIPKKAYKIPVVGDALRGLDRFLKFVSDRSTKTFIITFYFGRQNSMVEDIEFIKRIPDLIFTDPLAILRELLKFEIRSEGYSNKQEL